MKTVTIKKIDESNFIECFNLKLKDGQDKFVSHPIRSLAQAYVYYSQCTPFGIFNEENVMVGYFMVIYDYDEESYNLWHFMIDEKYQGQGYSKPAIKECLNYISKKPFGKSDNVILTCNVDNDVAISIYKSMGFKETGNVIDDELEMGLTLQ